MFSAWQTDRSSGLDAIMLAPTRELVSQLNQRARAHRLATEPNATEPEAVRVAMLADGNPASVGEQVITRANNRTLRMTATDWVKNGDRWTVLEVSRSGGLTVRHRRNGRTVRLPASYVAESVELGYATTVHTAQGVTADTMHGLATGEESRQQLYTMLTRGRIANHLYLQVVGDGDPHSLIRPERSTRAPRPSCSSGSWPATTHRGPPPPCNATSRPSRPARQTPPPGMSTPSMWPPRTWQDAKSSRRWTWRPSRLCPASPTSRPGPPYAPTCCCSPHTAPTRSPSCRSRRRRELDSAGDRAAVLDWRLDDTGLRNAGQGRCPGSPASRKGCATTGVGEYLAARSHLVRTLANQIEATVADTDPPAWERNAAPCCRAASSGMCRCGGPRCRSAPRTGARQAPCNCRKPPELAAPPQPQVAGDRSPALQEWGWLLNQLDPDLTKDPFAPMLADRRRRSPAPASTYGSCSPGRLQRRAAAR